MAIFAIGHSFAQTKTDSVANISAVTDTTHMIKHHRHSFLDAGITFQNNDVYLGRKPANTLPYYIPAISYYHKSGFFASTSLDYLKNSSTSRVDLFTIEGGYLFTTGKYDGMANLSKYFYNTQSTNLTSAIKTSIAYQNGYDLGFIKPSLTLTLNISNKVDYEGRLELSHTFSLFHDNLDLTPTVAATGSTLHYYDYYRQRIYKIKKKKKVVGTGTADVTTSVIDASTFRLMDYEPSLPIEYTLGKCTFSFTPTYAIPVNPATINAHSIRDNGQIIDNTHTEKIAGSFFFTLGVNILFR